MIIGNTWWWGWYICLFFNDVPLNMARAAYSGGSNLTRLALSLSYDDDDDDDNDDDDDDDDDR